MLKLLRLDYQKIEQIRREKRIPYAELAQLTKDLDPEGKGVSAHCCNSTLTGRSMCKADTAALICFALGVSVLKCYTSVDPK